jgi:hypothetical protein
VSEPVLVMTGYDANMASVGEISRRSQAAYAAQHGYDYLVVEDYAAGTHPSWQKMGKVLGQLSRYPVVLWLDADTVVTNRAIPFPSILQDRTGIVFSTDWSGSVDDPRNFSAGNFIATRCAGTAEIFRDAMTRTRWADQPLWDQSALRDTYRERFDLRKFFHVLPRRQLNAVPLEAQPNTDPWQPGDFLCHLTGINNSRRLEHIWKFDLAGIRLATGLPRRTEFPAEIDERHLAWLQGVLLDGKWVDALKIGTWKGLSTCPLLAGLRRGTVGSLTCCDIDFKPEFLAMVRDTDVVLRKMPSLELLRDGRAFDVVCVDGDHSYATVLAETRAITRMRPVPRLLAYHDVTYDIMLSRDGNHSCSGPAHAWASLQADGWLCAVDCRVRRGEVTHRGFMMATKDPAIHAAILRIMRDYCY